MNRHLIKHFILYVGAAILMTHELDAVMHNEWRVLPMTSFLSPEVGYQVFLWAHVPLFALTIAFLSHRKDRIRTLTASVLASFLVIHGGLHLLFSDHHHYEFTSVSSNLLIYGGSAFGVLYFILTRRLGATDKSSEIP